MSTRDPSPFGFALAADGEVISGGVIEVYDHAVCRGAVRLDALDALALEVGFPVRVVVSAITQLVELRLLRTDGLDGDQLVPTDPQAAVDELISPIERAIYRQRELADRLKGRIESVIRSRESAAEPVGAIDGLRGEAEIKGLLKLASDACRRELTVLRPAHEDEESLDALLDACFGALDRDVAVRVVCPHRSRADFAARARVRRLLEHGAEIRTVSQVPQASIVFDRSLAVVLSLPADETEPAARRIRDADVVHFLVDMFDQLWQDASPFEAEAPGYAEAADDLQRTIARLMAQGLTDDAVARRLGMSVRTCRRHIAALLRELDAVSRFQAGVAAARRFSVAESVLGG